MVATPGQRDRLMQKLKAETCFRRKSGNRDGAETDEASRSHRRGGSSGDSVPRPLGFIALMPSQIVMFYCRGSVAAAAPAWSGPGVGAQVASQQSLILRSVR